MSINRRRISFAVASSFLLEVINKISPLIILHHAQKNLGLSGFGLAQYQIAIFESIQPFISYGFVNYAIARVGTESDQRQTLSSLFSHIFVLKCINALLVLLAFCAFTFNSGQTEGGGYSLGLLAVVLIANILDAFWLFIVQQKLTAMTVFSMVMRLISLLLIIQLINKPTDSLLFVALSLMPNCMIALFSGCYGLVKLRLSPIVQNKLLEILKLSTPFALVMVAMTVFDRMDIFLVKRWFGLELAGLYSAPAKLIQSLSLMIGSLGIPFYAEIVKLKDRESIYHHVSVSLWFLMALVSPVVFGSFFVEKELLSLIFKDLPPSADFIMTILSTGMIGAVLLSTFGLQILLSKGKPMDVFKAILIGAATVFGVSFLVQSQFGFKSIAFGMAAGRLVLGLGCFYYARAFLPKAPWAAFFKPLGAGACMGIVLMLLDLDSLVLCLGVGATVYLASLVSMNWREVSAIARHPKIRKLFGDFGSHKDR